MIWWWRVDLYHLQFDVLIKSWLNFTEIWEYCIFDLLQDTNSTHRDVVDDDVEDWKRSRSDEKMKKTQTCDDDKVSEDHHSVISVQGNSPGLGKVRRRYRCGTGSWTVSTATRTFISRNSWLRDCVVGRNGSHHPLLVGSHYYKM